MNEEEFLATASRGAGDRLNAGLFWRDEDGHECRATWVEATAELYVVHVSGHVEVLGTLKPWDLVWAIVRGVPRGKRRISTLRAAVRAAPRDPERISAYLSDVRRRRVEAEARRRDERRHSFVVMALGALPDPDPPFREGDYDQADWLRVAAASVNVLAAGIDPLDHTAIREHADATLSETDAPWLELMFSDPIVVDRDLSGFLDGLHRTWHMLRAGVTHCVVELE